MPDAETSRSAPSRFRVCARHSNGSIFYPVALAFFVALAAPASPASAVDKLRYSATVAGIPLGKIKLFLNNNAPEYSVGVSFSMIPLLRQIFNGDANADVSGDIVEGRYVPRTSVFRYDRRKGERRVVMAFDEAGIPVGLVANPPIRKTDYRMTLDEAAGATDPATAAAVFTAPREKPCEITHDVFDGAKRHRISLIGEKSPVRDGVVTCNGLYQRINGFKAKYMTPERRSWPFTAILTEREGHWIPLKITADTKFGPASATLRR